MPTFIKPGFWEKAKKGYRDWLNLDLLVQSLVPSSSYKVYTALLTQSGTNDPVATVLENTLGGTVVWTYGSTGLYQATLTGAFPANKLFFIVEPESSYNVGPQIYSQETRVLTRISDDILILKNTELVFTAGVFTSAGLANNFANISVEIRVYN